MTQVRRARQVVRRVDVWTVLRFSLLLYLSLLVVVVIAGTLLYTVAGSTGVRDNVQDFMREAFALDDFKFEGRKLLESTVLGGLVMVLLGTLANTLVAVLYNLITEISGGIELIVVDQEISSSNQ